MVLGLIIIGTVYKAYLDGKAVAVKEILPGTVVVVPPQLSVKV